MPKALMMKKTQEIVTSYLEIYEQYNRQFSKTLFSFKVVIKMNWMERNCMPFAPFFLLCHTPAMYPQSDAWWAFVRGRIAEEGTGHTSCGLVAFACWQPSNSDCQQCHKNGSIHCDDLYCSFFLYITIILISLLWHWMASFYDPCEVLLQRWSIDWKSL